MKESKTQIYLTLSLLQNKIKTIDFLYFERASKISAL